MKENSYEIKNLRVNKGQFLSKREYALHSTQQFLLEQGVDEAYVRLYTQYRTCRDYEELKKNTEENDVFYAGIVGTAFGTLVLSLADNSVFEISNEISTALGSIFITTGIICLGYSAISSFQKKNPYDHKKVQICIPGIDIHEVDKQYDYFLENAPEPVTLRK